MLRKLIIQNYAIIDEITIDFSQQLNIITGETGAGKSILMGALSLILGERADSSVLVNNQKKCFIEGYFKADHKAEVIDYLKLQELDIDEDLVLRREIATNGKSRAFINDTPATLQQLKHLAGLLVDLHQQFDTLELGDSDFQRQVIDALAGNEATLLSYRTVYFNWQHITKELQSLKEAKAAFLKEFDYHQFLFNELEELNLKEHELEELEVELKMLSNAEGIKTNIDLVQNSLHNSEQPIVGQLKQLGNHLNAFAALHQELPELVARMKATQVELQDIADELEKISTHIQFDEKRIEWINQRMSDGYKLVKKHGVQNSHDLIQIKNQLEQKLQNVLQLDDEIIAKEKQAANLIESLEKTAEIITAGRKKIIAPFEKDVNTLLKQVGMPNAKIQTRLLPTSLQEYGKEQIDLLFDANNSNRFEPIRKVASGGELSRLMLCIKSLVAESIDLPTLIFDEIDTGISGEAAKQVGLIMQKMAAQRQIICITHQPQIAGKANAHFYVYKEKKGEMVKTTIRLLDNDERIKAIASMLSGEKPTTAAMENAREMMN
ncbi:MAG: DNA repair protein RecN [Sediminibacterium sp.]|nr:MAG: DNA repair protein RecN [Chitinophagaceae bacterium]MDP1842599.1 DNA repair protein RecN [Sediminibacterium sp.]